ncbi:MAG: hypothetical protein ACRELF_01055 [Gemmataceae bacterium]
MPRSNPVAELAQKLLTTLEQQRQSGGEYPLTVARLASLADPRATPELVGKALAKKPFAAQWTVANKKDANSPIALAEDGEHLAVSPLLLEYALGLLCSADKPLHTATKAVNKVDKVLRPAFKAVLEQRIAENTLPSTVGVVSVHGKAQLYLLRFPPPKKPAEELSEKLVQALIELRERGPDAYPAELHRVVEQTGRAPAARVLTQALNTEPFRSQAMRPLPKRPDSPVVLADDSERLLASPRLLRLALAVARTPDNQAVSANDLAKKLAKNLQGDFLTAVNRQVSARILPDDLGVLVVKKKPLLFLRADINAGSRPACGLAKPQVAAMDFAQLFDEAFARLDREHGGHNHVSLVELRRAVPVERAAFDIGLRDLRRAGRYGLSAAEGRHGLRVEEQDAAIHEDGSLLLFVSRREMCR